MTEIPRDRNPFPRSGVSVDEHGIAHYDGIPATLLDVLAAQVAERPDSEAVVELGSDRLSYRQLWDGAARVAGGLRAAGLNRGDRVAVRYPAGINWVLAFWGTVMAGGIAVAVNTRSAQPEVDFVLSDAEAHIDLSPATPMPDGRPYVTEQLDRADVAALFYTSGTTGHPKGVPTTHEAFLTNNENAVRCLRQPRDIGEGLRTLISVPLFHVTGCNSQLLAATALGGAAVIMPALNLDQMIATLGDERISVMVTVPAIYALLLRHNDFGAADVSGVRWVGYGGAPIAPSLVRAVKDAFPQATVFNGYGMTETASLMTALPDEEAVEHADSVGYAVPSVDLGVSPINDGSGDLVGELLTRGGNVTAGYWNRPDATAATFVDGWLHTGDVVRVDDAGRVHIVDRLKDIINRGGENISSVEVEAALLAAPGVTDACVLAVPDEVMGEKVGAVLVGDEVDVPAVLEQCREQLADYKVPQYVNVVTTPLPRNAGGKLLKGKLRDQVQWGSALR
ncbi:class I adenylate-forming enzyme family protein [Mycobacterium asiaticum]|uniref:Acyl-CoA dehydrogenase n=1 Tax=Mycobacterium asiaticum TaxID=1790 RepID=A0A1A3MIZ5_MYCAS|nr:AMP-binding protein [Mycobacterium asiaticum]OBK09933.1 acyl-CoA dehydrogenase [Mycobacterium asiaticum]